MGGDRKAATGIEAMDGNRSQNGRYRIPSPELRDELKRQMEILVLTLQRVTGEVSAIAKNLSECDAARGRDPRRAAKNGQRRE
jgi:hypothetical protein